MRKISTFLLAFIATCTAGFGQYFGDDFESYTVNSYLGPQSAQWTTWSNADGSSEDVNVVNTNSSSGSKSIYFNSPGGGGPNDVVLPFGGVNSSGRFKFTAKMFIPTGKAAYFNFQGGSSVGQIWAMELYFRTGSNFNLYGGSGLNGNYPQNKWFEVVFDCDLTADVWEMFIDGTSKGTFSNSNNISFIDIFPADGSSEWWMDDVSYCVNNSCNADISVQSIVISPSTICTHHNADVTVKLKNNSTFGSNDINLAIDIGPDRITKAVKMNKLGGGKDSTITFQGLFVSKIAGTGLTVKASTITGDPNPLNDFATTTVNVNPSPSQASLGKGTPFKTPAPLSSGTIGDPDIVAAKDVATYDITPPKGYSNSGFNSTWKITGITMKTLGGATVSSSYYSFSQPGSSNGKITFTPDSLITDSTIALSFSISDVGTGCDSVLTRYIYIAPKPKAGYTNANVCHQSSVTFTNTSVVTSGALTYAWDFGDSTTSNLGTPTKLYKNPGAYNVKLLVTTPYGYKDSITQTVNVYPIPGARFNFVNACEGAAVSMSDNSILPTGTPTFEWNFGTFPASTGTGASVTKQYAQPGIYLVTLTVTVNGCSSTTTRYVTQAPRSVPSFTFPTLQCDNGNVQFVNTTTQPSFGTTNYLWKFNDGGQATEVNPGHTYNNFKSYNVVLVSSTDLGCVDSITKTVTLRQSPVAGFTKSAASCNNDPINFTNTSIVPTGSTNTYQWDFGDANTSVDANPVYQYSSPGSYKVVLKSLSSNGCSSETESTIAIKLKPTADFNAASVCKGSTTEFKNGSKTTDSNALTYLWRFGNGDSSTLDNPMVKYAAAGTFNATLIATHPNGCTDTKTGSVKVFDLPVVSILNASNHTGDGTINFTTNATGTGYTYTWLFGDGATSTSQSPKYKFLHDGRYVISLAVTTPEGCTAIDIDTIYVNSVGIADVSANSVNVYPNPSQGRFTIDLGNINKQDIQAITITDMLGRIVVKEVAANATEIDLSGQASGIYYLNISTVSGTQTVKLTISK